MKRISNLAVLAIIALSSCVSVPDYDTSYSNSTELTPEQINDNVKNVFGTTFDPNQDWTMSAEGSVKITADANLNDIVKVQVLSESPFLNGDAMVLNQKDVSYGETVELTYEAPKGATKLIAACVNKTGNYFVKTFDINAQTVSFKSTSSRAITRAVEGSYPDLSTIKIELNRSMPSYNARRTIEAAKEGADANISAWKNSGWENERLWRPAKTTNKEKNIPATESNGWIIDGQVARVIPNIDDTEKERLEAALNAMEGFDDQSKKYNNMQVIRELHINSKYNNYLTTNGEPLIIAPVGLLSTDASYVYYYYYNPNAVSGMSEAQKTAYIKSLPKFRAFDCSYTKNALKQTEPKRVTIENNRYKGFFKMHEYLLPYYGDEPLPTTDATIVTAAVPHSTYSGIYRIRCEKDNGKGKYYYFTYCGSDKSNDKLALYDENNKNQLWQIFTMPESKGGGLVLYNIGAKLWLYQADSGGYTIFSNNKNTISVIDDIETDGDIIRFKTQWGHLGANSDNNRVALNKDNSNTDTKKHGIIDWHIEEYNYTGTRPEGAIDNIEFETKTIAFEMNPVSLTIPAGYKVGFMNRKGNENDSNNFTAVNKGETYGDGNLNKEINSFPQFSSAVDLYGMRLTDPRVAIFKANNHNYITFEDGTDCNFTDIVIEIVSGIQVEDGDLSQKPKNAVYTYCFEDRQNGDYDMNDIVIKAMRLDATHVLFSVEACGAYDELNLRGIHGKLLSSNIDVHQLFGVSNPKTYINTQPGTTHHEPIQEVVEVPNNFSFNTISEEKADILDPLKRKVLHIYNKTEEREVRLSTRGEDPHGIMIPCDFKYPTEKTSLHHAYPHFLDWAKGDNTYYDWYNQPNPSGVYDSGGFQILESTRKAYPKYFKDQE